MIPDFRRCASENFQARVGRVQTPVRLQQLFERAAGNKMPLVERSIAAVLTMLAALPFAHGRAFLQAEVMS